MATPKPRVKAKTPMPMKPPRSGIGTAIRSTPATQAKFKTAQAATVQNLNKRGLTKANDLKTYSGTPKNPRTEIVDQTDWKHTSAGKSRSASSGKKGSTRKYAS
jgi:hypothetical protein